MIYFKKIFSLISNLWKKGIKNKKNHLRRHKKVILKQIKISLSEHNMFIYLT